MKSQNLRLEIEYLPVDSLRPYDRNARKHADDDVDAIAALVALCDTPFLYLARRIGHGKEVA